MMEDDSPIIFDGNDSDSNDNGGGGDDDDDDDGVQNNWTFADVIKQLHIPISIVNV